MKRPVLAALCLTLCCAAASGAASAQTAAKAAPKHKAQSEVARNASFAEVAGTDAAVGKALDAKEMAAAKKLIGKDAAIKGTVVKVFAPSSNSIVILNFAEKYQEAAVAVLKPESFARFPEMSQLKGKRVLVTGTLTDYKGQPQIELKEPAQLKVIK